MDHSQTKTVTFADHFEGTGTLSYSATTSGDTHLATITENDTTLTINSATDDPNADPRIGTITVTVTATDSSSATVTDTLRVTVGPMLEPIGGPISTHIEKDESFYVTLGNHFTTGTGWVAGAYHHISNSNKVRAFYGLRVDAGYGYVPLSVGYEGRDNGVYTGYVTVTDYLGRTARKDVKVAVSPKLAVKDPFPNTIIGNSQSRTVTLSD